MSVRFSSVFCGMMLLLTGVAAQASFQTNSAYEAPATVHLVIGADLAPRIRSRVTELLSEVTTTHVVIEQDPSVMKTTPGDWVIAIGENPVTRRLLAKADVENLGPEGFVVRSNEEKGVVTLIADGNSANGERTTAVTNRGLSFATYELLQQVGFRFFHPFTPRAPHVLKLAHAIDLHEKPRWPIRGFHLHTMHPIELAHVLNAWGPNGPDDTAGFESLLKEWDLYLEWSIAHRQNVVQWALLADKVFTSFNDSTVRQQRLARLVQMSHGWGIVTGIDVGIVLQQQNTWRLIRDTGKNADVAGQIRSRVGWLMNAGFDYLNAEMGFSEFQAAKDQLMLDWMNAITRETEDVYHRPTFIKAHVSSGQHAKNYKDPETGQPINFNFLPHYADKRLVVMPHTVEVYGLDDPAPTYGNQNFSEIRRFTSMEAGTRPVVFYPELAYWISYDIDVPLFLPIYGERRLHDLRILARDEEAGTLGRGIHAGSRIQGQIVFSSGFEWGYWFQHLITAQSAWNPRLDINDDVEAWKAIVREALRIENDPKMEDVISLLDDTVRTQQDLLIDGRVDGKAPKQIEKLNGMAYMCGQDTWGEFNTVLAEKFKFSHAATNPNRVAAKALRKDRVVNGISYVNELQPLLDGMDQSFSALASRYDALEANPPEGFSDEMAELRDGARMNAYRARQMHALYDAEASATMGRDEKWRQDRIDAAKAALDSATKVADERTSHFRTDIERIAGWKRNPTVYRYGYLWTARRLFYWWRDEGRVVLHPKNLCFMNVINPADVAFANGTQNIAYKVLSFLSKIPGFGSLKACLNPPADEPNLQQTMRADRSD